MEDRLAHLGGLKAEMGGVKSEMKGVKDELAAVKTNVADLEIYMDYALSKVARHDAHLSVLKQSR